MSLTWQHDREGGRGQTADKSVGGSVIVNLTIPGGRHLGIRAAGRRTTSAADHAAGS